MYTCTFVPVVISKYYKYASFIDLNIILLKIFIKSTKHSRYPAQVKGQTISKENYGVLNSPKDQTKLKPSLSAH